MPIQQKSVAAKMVMTRHKLIIALLTAPTLRCSIKLLISNPMMVEFVTNVYLKVSPMLKVLVV